MQTIEFNRVYNEKEGIKEVKQLHLTMQLLKLFNNDNFNPLISAIIEAYNYNISLDGLKHEINYALENLSSAELERVTTIKIIGVKNVKAPYEQKTEFLLKTILEVINKIEGKQQLEEREEETTEFKIKTEIDKLKHMNWNLHGRGIPQDRALNDFLNDCLSTKNYNAIYLYCLNMLAYLSDDYLNYKAHIVLKKENGNCTDGVFYTSVSEILASIQDLVNSAKLGD